MPVVGFLQSGSPENAAEGLVAFRQGLSNAGFVEGRNVTIEYRWAESQVERLPELAADLVRRQVTVIATAGGGFPLVAAKAATSTIPIVFNAGIDPVRYGIVASFNRPGGNITGVSSISSEIETKRFDLLSKLVPQAMRFAALSSKGRASEYEINQVLAAARSNGRELYVAKAESEQEIEPAFAAIARYRPDALMVLTHPLFSQNRRNIVALSARHAIPAIYAQREFVDFGGLMSYGASVADASRLAGNYVGRILKGEKPADLPVQQSTKFELAINLKTARALGLAIPETLLATADEVIQ